jgi:hypothetical protein
MNIDINTFNLCKGFPCACVTIFTHVIVSDRIVNGRNSWLNMYHFVAKAVVSKLLLCPLLCSSLIFLYFLSI